MDSKISSRLEQVAAFVPVGARLADIGSDHAYLPLFLKKKNHISYAVAGEVVDGPYQSALKNVTEAGEQQGIHVRLANGLEAIREEDAIDAITIAGMGGRLIARILEEGKNQLLGVKRLILQPNNREDELREWLEDNGYTLIAESIVTENQKIYEILVAEPGVMSLTAPEKRFGPFLMAELSDSFRAKWAKEFLKLESALQQIPQEHLAERQHLEEKIAMIKEVLHYEG